MALRHQTVRQYVFHYQSFHINKSQPLGHGSYGAVYKAKCDQLPCAAKVLHQTILDPLDPGSDKIMQRFRQECEFLSSIRHPYIVQYLGMTRDRESGLPVLLMELLDESLTKMLERSKQPLAYHIEIDICHDVSLAVAYLHSNDIIHRDLSSNNVLIIAGKRAKVTDFGMSKLAGTAPAMTPLTMCPGTLAYMPPEALNDPPRYTKKLDCFSEGVITIQVCTRQWPDPGPRTQTLPFPASPTGSIEMPVLEAERRKKHIDLIDPNHDLLPTIMNSLSYDEQKRPSAEELCERVGCLKEKSEYGESMKQVHNQPNKQLQEQVSVLNELKQVVEQQREENKKLKNEIKECRQEIRQQLLEKDEEIALRESQLHKLSQQLEMQEKITAEIQQTNNSLQKQVEQLGQNQGNVAVVSKLPSTTTATVSGEVGKQEQTLDVSYVQSSLQKPMAQLMNPDNSVEDHSTTENMELRWRKEEDLPFRAMCRGAEVVDGNMAYFMGHYGYIYCYDFTTRKWKELPKCSYFSSGLTVIRGQLTTIGGSDWDPNLLYQLVRRREYKVVKKLLSLNSNKKWVENFPPLPTERTDVVTVTTGHYLIVAGGRNKDRDKVCRVDILNTETRSWSEAASLPVALENASTAICGDQLYILVANYSSGLLLTCDLSALIRSLASTPFVWHKLADSPAKLSTCVAVNGELLAVGGRLYDNRKLKATGAVHKFNPATNSWDLISSMPTGRYQCFVTVIPTNELMVVGGCTESSVLGTRIVEVADFSAK